MEKNRHIKSKRMETWTDSRIEVKSVIESLGIESHRFKEVDIHSWKDIENNIWSTFSNRLESCWIWESLIVPGYSVPYNNSTNKVLEKLVDRNEKVWLLINETVREKSKFWIYEGYIDEVQRVIEESYRANELIVASKKYAWILTLNHHDIITGTGEMIDKLKVIEKEIISGNKNNMTKR